MRIRTLIKTVPWKIDSKPRRTQNYENISNAVCIVPNERKKTGISPYIHLSFFFSIPVQLEIGCWARTHTVLLLLISLYQCAWSSESSKMWNNLMKLVAQFSAQFPQHITSNPIETDHFPNWFIFPDVFLHSFSHIVWRFFNVRRRNKTLVY